MDENEYKVEVDLDNATATFKIDLVGKQTQESYKGVFVVKCLLNPMDFINADKTYRQLIGGKPMEAHEHASALAFALSQLKYRVNKFPPFWENREMPGGHIDDDNIIIEVLNRALYAQERYVRLKKEEVDNIEKQLTEDIMGGIIQEMPEIDGAEPIQSENQDEDIDLPEL